MDKFPALAKFLNTPIADLPPNMAGRDVFLALAREVVREGGLRGLDRCQVEVLVKMLVNG